LALLPTHGSTPADNVGYWVPKLERNAKRDAANDAALRAAGWTVLRAWEHEPPGEIVARITAGLSST
jgi:DNA mismatch endonuclease (patch repair protein)